MGRKSGTLTTWDECTDRDKTASFTDEGFPREHVRARHYSLNWRVINDEDAGVERSEHSADANAMASETTIAG
jgi:hypothetical protein